MASAEAKRIKAVLARANSTSTLKSAVTPPSAFGGSSRQDAESIFSGNSSRHGSIQSNQLSAGGQTQHSLRKTAWENNSMTRPASTGGNLQSSSKSLGGNTAASDRSGKSGQQQQSAAARLRAMLVDKVQAKYPGSIRAAVRSIFRNLADAAPTTSVDSLSISPEEFEAAVRVLLPGLSESDVCCLSSAFDIDHSGDVTVGEFAAALEADPSRAPTRGGPTAALPTDHSRPGTATSTLRRPVTAESVSTVLGSEWDRASMASRSTLADDIFQLRFGDTLPVFVLNLKNRLLDQAEDELARLPHQTRLQKHRSTACVALSKEILRAHLLKYREPSQQQPPPRPASAPSRRSRSGSVGSGSRKSSGTGSSSRQQEGGKPVRLSFRDFAQALSHFREIGQPFPERSTIEKLWLACDRGDPEVLIESIYAAPEKMVVNQFGFGKLVPNPLDMSNPQVERGPFVVNAETQQTALKALSGKAALCPSKPNEVPQRIRYRYCRTPVQPPASFDPALIAQSAMKPDTRLELEHVYGYCRNDTIPGPNLFASASGQAVVYTSAAVGIVHHLATNRQAFFLGHTDDISALTVDPTGAIAASGQMGKAPFICLWDTTTALLKAKIGQGFFQRLVCCLGFSGDGKKLAAVSGDDHHMLGVWVVETGELLAEMSAQNGPPPQVLGVRWMPEGDELMTVGPSHFKVWALSFHTPEPPPGRSASLPALPTTARLSFRNGSYGGTAKHPRVMQCVEVLGGGSWGGPLVVATGGDNGYVYLWQKSGKEGARVAWSCRAAWFAHKGAVHRLLADGPTGLLSAGADGLLKRWDVSRLDAVSEKAAWPICAPPPSQPSLTSHVEAKTNPFPKVPSLKSVPAQIREANVTKMVVCDLARLGGASSSVVAVGTRNGRVVTLDTRSGVEAEVTRGHHDNLYGLAVHPTRPDVFATAGEDGLLLVMSTSTRRVEAVQVLPARGRSVAFSPNGEHIAVGCCDGVLLVLAYQPSKPQAPLQEIKVRRDVVEMIDEVKFSPNGRMLAAGSHDNYIDIYSTANYEPVRRLKGHTSYVTHLDWSKDSRVLQSNCGAYEIIWWDVKAGAMMTSTRDSVEANTDWATWTCVLGFPVMGIWQPDTDGTDVNSVDRSPDQRLLVSGDDFGQVKLFRYPVLVEHAPAAAFTGHSSHVMNVRFSGDGLRVLSVGGHDMSVFQWRVRQAGDASPPRSARSSHSATHQQHQALSSSSHHGSRAEVASGHQSQARQVTASPGSTPVRRASHQAAAVEEDWGSSSRRPSQRDPASRSAASEAHGGGNRRAASSLQQSGGMSRGSAPPRSSVVGGRGAASSLSSHYFHEPSEQRSQAAANNSRSRSQPRGRQSSLDMAASSSQVSRQHQRRSSSISAGLRRSKKPAPSSHTARSSTRPW